MKKTLLNIIQVFVLFLGLVHLVNAQCPDFSGLTEADMEVDVIESTCFELGGEPSGGVIFAPSPNPCPVGSTLFYSEDLITFTSEVPTYIQNGGTTVITRCQCDSDSGINGPIGTVSTNPGECPTCIITNVQVTNISPCENIGNDEDGSNDIFLANVILEYEDIPPSGTLSISGFGGSTQSIDLNGLDPNTHTVTDVSFSANGSMVGVFIDINGDWRCRFQEELDVVAPPNCSECSLFGVTVENTSGCINVGDDNDDSNDIFLADVTVNFNLPPTTGELMIFGDFTSISIPVSNLIGNSHTFSDVQFNANGITTSVFVEFTDNISCSTFFRAQNLPPCSNLPPCEITSISLDNISDCINVGNDDNGLNDVFTTDLVIEYTNLPNSGQLVITTTDDSFTFDLSTLDPTSLTLSNMFFDANGQDITVEVEVIADEGCSYEAVAGQAPFNCSEPAITNLIIENTTGCMNAGSDGDDSNDYYFADITVDYNMPSFFGVLEIVELGLSVPFDVLTGTSYTFTDVHLPADNNLMTFTAVFSSHPGCAFSVEVQNSPPCSENILCEIFDVSLNVTSDCINGDSDLDGSNDYFQADLIISLANHPDGGELEISGAISDLIVLDANNTQYTISNLALSANGDPVTFDISLDGDPNCQGQFTFAGLPSCSDEPAFCPDLSMLTVSDMEVNLMDSSCDTPGGTPSGGEVFPLSPSPCPAGSTLFYSDNFAAFTTEVPTYVQDESRTILTRCQCDEDASVIGPLGMVVTTPGECPTCIIIDVSIIDMSPCVNGDDDLDEFNDFFTADLEISYIDLPPSGNLFISTINDFISISIDSLDPGSHTITGLTFPADGQPVNIFIEINGPWSCSFSASIGVAPESCSELCILPELTAVATCTDADGNDADQDEYFIRVELFDLGSSSELSNGVNVSTGTREYLFDAVGTFYLGPFQHSGTGTTTIDLLYFNEGADCEGSLTVSEVLCGYTSDNGLNASGPSCDCEDDIPGTVLAQVAPGSFGADTSVIVYVLVDSDDEVSAVNNTGLFTDLTNDAFRVYPINVGIDDLMSFLAALPAEGEAFEIPSDVCAVGCGVAAYTVDCVCRIDDVAIQKVVNATGFVNIGDNVNFTISVINQGTDPIYNIVVQDYLPVGLDFVASDNTLNAFANNPNTTGGNTITATVATSTPLNPGETLPVTITLTVSASSAGLTLINTAEITAATRDHAGLMPIKDEDDPLPTTGGGSGEIDNNISDGSNGGVDAQMDQDDFDMALLQVCPFLAGSVDSPQVCKGTESAPINLQITLGMVEHIQIFFDDDARAAGFTDFIDLGQPMPTDYVIPSGITEGVFRGEIALIGSGTCITRVPFTITIECPNCGTFPWTGSR